MSLVSNASQEQNASLVIRSAVEQKVSYKEYRDCLRYDFFYSCAYCSMSEGEAQAISFTIDHYEPRKSHSHLEHTYDNLMYACNECNVRKGDRTPPENARKEGYRFFRPDVDIREEHFRLTGLRVEHVSNIGYYTIEAIDLNRQSLRRLREIRQRLKICDQFIWDGIMALRSFPIDQLQNSVKGRAYSAIQNAIALQGQHEQRIDDLLRKAAQSPFLDQDLEKDERTKERRQKMAQMESMYPGEWRAPRKSKKEKVKR